MSRVLVVSVDAPPRLGGVSATAHHLANSFAETEGWSGLLGPQGTVPPRELHRSYTLIEDWESRVDRRAGPESHQEDMRIEALIGRVIELYSVEAVLLGHGFYYGPGTVRAARAAGVRVAAFAHGLEVSSQLDDRVARRDRGTGPDALARRLRHTLDSVDTVFTNSTATAASLRRYTIAAPLSVCGVGLSVADLNREIHLSPTVHPGQRAERRRALNLTGKPLIVSIGRLVQHKRVDLALLLASRIPAAQLAIAGDGPERTALETRASALSLGDRVRFLGNIAEHEKWALLRAADFHVLFSEFVESTGAFEGFGIALLEGCAAGSVALSSAHDGMADFVHGAGGGVALDLSKHPGAAAERVAALACDADERAAIVGRGRTAIGARWLWPHVAAHILDNWPQRQPHAPAGAE